MRSERKIYETALIFIVIFAMMAFISIECTLASTIYVPDDYSTIQAAVDAATPGDTIIVRDGAYIENIEVDKRLTIRSENGYDSTIVQAEDPGGHVFNVSADYVEISGFTVKGATGWLAAGIYLYYADYCNISNNICSNNDWGIYLEYSSNNSISGNDVINNDGGIYLEYSSNNTISGNDVINNNYYGSYLEYSSNNSISGNTFVNDGLFVSKSSYHNTVEGNTVNNKPLVYLEGASDYKVKDAGQVILVNCRNITVENLDLSNTCVGIELWVTVDSIIADNTVSNNWRGIYLGDSSNNSISGNNVSDNNVNGIYLRYSSNNSISGNDVSNNWRGIYLYYSSNNSISGNDVNNNDDGIYLGYSSNNTISGNDVNNSGDGIRFYESNNNLIYLNNFINNTDNVYSYGSTNLWNSKKKISYTYNETTYTNYLGNYWSDYNGTDTDKDGIGDTPYSIDSDKDNYPLMERFENYFAPVENIVNTGTPANPPHVSQACTTGITHYGKGGDRIRYSREVR